MTKIYFAGPDVFREDYKELCQEVRKECQTVNIEPLLPGDQVLDGAENIVAFNLKMIDEADFIIANLNPFRNRIEPDSGTVFECGYGFAKGKTVIGWLNDRRSLIEKITEESERPGADPVIRPEGTFIEDFNYPLNIMLSVTLKALASSCKEAIEIAHSLKSS